MTHEYLTHSDILAYARTLTEKIEQVCSVKDRQLRLYAVPRGGIPVAYLLSGMLSQGAIILQEPKDADIIIDDIIDSGKTRDSYTAQYPDKLFAALLEKEPNSPFVVFPWEHTPEGAIGDNILRIIQYIGDDPKREGLADTPRRVVKAMGEWFSGYSVTNDQEAKLYTCFEERLGMDDPVILRDIPFYSHCEHHMAPFFGTCTIGYLPASNIVGLSKLVRVVNMYARRLQVQERLTQQIAHSIQTHLNPRGVCVITEARHLCMESRGVHTPGVTTKAVFRTGVLQYNDYFRDFQAML